MEISEKKVGDCNVVAVSGRLDAGTVGDFDRCCGASVDRGDHRLVIDLSELEYISSAGLRAILSYAKQLKSLDGGLAVCGPTGVVQEVFTISGFDALIPICASVEEATSVI